MAPIQIRLLGNLLVATEAGVIHFPTQKTGSLFAFFAVNPEGVTRERLAGILWPDFDEERARRNLSTSLWRMKTALRRVPECNLVASGDNLCLHLGDVDVDVIRLRSLSDQCKILTGDKLLDVLRRAVALYRGDFLDGFNDEWCGETRRELRELYVRMLKRLVVVCREGGSYRDGIDHACRVVEMDPLDEDAHRELISLYYLAGDRASALGQYETLRRTLKNELSVEPAPATVDLWQYIRTHSNPLASPSAGLPSSPRELPQFEGFPQVPIIGRDKQLAALLHCIDHAVQGGGGAVVVVGEPGVGKTRLVEAVTVEATLRGLDVLHGRCPDSHEPAPYQAFVQALWPRIMSAQQESGRDAAPLALLLRALAPDASSGARALGPSSADGTLGSSVVMEAFLKLLLATPNVDPTLLVLEDMHDADKASMNLLASLLGRLGGARLLVAVTLRSHGAGARDVLSLLVANRAVCLRLDPLSEAYTERLIRAALRSKMIPPPLARFVFERTDGVPLCILELLRLLKTERLLRRDPYNQWTLVPEAFNAKLASVPSRIYELICRRVDVLGPGCRSILNLAAVLGTEADFDHLRELADVAEDDLVDRTDELVRAELLRETERGFRFPHGSIRNVVLSSLTRARRRHLHLQVGTLVEQTAPGRTEDLAWHFGEAGHHEKALVYAEASGDKARAVHANGDAVMWYSKALQLTGGPGDVNVRHPHQRAQILLKRQGVLDLLGDRSGQVRDIDELQIIAQGMGDRRLLAEALLLRANLFTRLNAAGQALDFARKAARLFCDVDDPRGQAKAEETAGAAYHSIRRYDFAERSIRRSLRLFRRLGDDSGQARGLFHLGEILSFRNHNTAALKHLDRADVLMERLGDRRSRGYVYVQRGVLYRLTGKVALSEFFLLSGIEILKQIGDRVGEARGLTQLACTHAAAGKLREALHESERALRIATATNDVRARIMILNNTAYSVLRPMGIFTRAGRYISQAMELVREAGGVESSATYADTAAAVQLEKGNIPEAFRWSKLSEALHRSVGRKNYIGLDIRLRLGFIHLEMGNYRFALTVLCGAYRQLAQAGELGSQLHVGAALANLYLGRGDISEAMKYASELLRLLKRVDGVDQIQNVYWSRFRVLEGAGQRAAARRALRQAYTAVMQQAWGLKGPLKRRFLEVIRINRLILQEAARRGIREFGGDAALFYRQALAPDAPILPSARDSRPNDGKDAPVAPAPVFGRVSVMQRRKILAQLLSTRRMTQKAVADNLGVSVRTVRNDIAALRHKGILSASTRSGMSQHASWHS